MLQPIFAKQFERDLKRLEKRGNDLDKIKTVIQLICDESPLPDKHKDHSLKGKWEGCRDCHIEPDWVLIYAVDKDEKTAAFVRTGSHSDLF